MYIKSIIYFLEVLFLFFLTACGGGGSGSDTVDTQTQLVIEEPITVEKVTPQSAYLIDTAVEGVSYVVDSTSGVTDINGKIDFLSTDTVALFKVGNVILGDFNLSKLNDDSKIFINEILGFQRNESNDEKVTKLLQFIQSLDVDNNPMNGISIDKNTTALLLNSNIDFRDNNISIDELNITIQKLSKELISKELAVTYFEKSLQEVGIENDSYPPIFISSQQLHIKENQLASFNVEVIDASNVTFSLIGEDANYFSINEQTGLITFKEAPDYELKNNYFITVGATDSNGQISFQELNIIIEDVTEETSYIPTLIVVLNWNDYYERDATDWYNKFFNPYENSVNQWLDETMLSALTLVPIKESYGINDDGVIMVDMHKNHPGGDDATTFRDVDLFNAITSDEVVNNVDFAALDKNNDGILNREELQVIFIVAGGELAYGDPIDHSIWAHSWGYPSDLAPSVDDVKILQYGFDQQTLGLYSCFGANHSTHQATIGIMVHELGHSLFDLDDYYDDGGGSGLGWYDVMSGGGWAKKVGDIYPGETPTQYSAFNRIDTGFDMNVTEAVDTKNFTITCSSKDIIKLPTSKDNEYFLLECRDTSKKASDIALNYMDYDFTEDRLFAILYHVDTNKYDNFEDGYQTEYHHYKVAVVEKDTSVLMTSSEHINADFNDVYLLGDIIPSNRLTLYDGTVTNYSIEISGQDYIKRTMTFKITKN